MLATLEAEHFRNLSTLAWAPGAGRHLLLGGNGAGKTSLLEAVYVTATTRSFRTPRLAECVRHGTDALRLVAEIEGVARTRLAVSWGRDGIDRAVNGSRGPLASHLAALPVVAWTAQEVEVLTGPPARRRRFLDRGVVSLRSSSLDALRRYREALRQKRELLAPGRGAGGRPAPPSASDLAIWNRVLAEAAAAVARLRARYVEHLANALGEVLAEVGLPFPEVRLRYRPSPEAALDGPDAIAARLEAAAPTERRRRMPLLGPHRDDLAILWGDHPVSEVASAGETKALSVALLAAHGRAIERAGKTPVYLLDDLDAELAPETLAAVWRVFKGGAQVLASSNRPAVWEALAVDRCWNLREGVLRRA